MKITKYYSLAIALCLLTFTACLKDDAHFNDFSKVGTIIELMDADPAWGLITDSLAYSKTPADIATRVNVAAPYPLSSALSVTLSIDKAALVKWKADNSDVTSELLPDSTYTIPSATVTIPVNQRVATFIVKVNTSKINTSHDYILPISISDASGQNISSNFKTIFYGIAVKQ